MQGVEELLSLKSPPLGPPLHGPGFSPDQGPPWAGLALDSKLPGKSFGAEEKQNGLIQVRPTPWGQETN